MPRITAPCEARGYYAEHVRMLLNSYRRLLGRPLTAFDEEAGDLPKKIFFADFALMSHDTAPDPLFNYANRTALDLFEYAWEELIGLPSRFSAEPVNREEREKLLAEVSAQGYIDHYSGIRFAKSGKRFKIANAVVWNVYDNAGQYRGQAACLKDWEVL